MTTGIYLSQSQDAIKQTLRLIGYFRAFIRSRQTHAPVPAHLPFSLSIMDKPQAQALLANLVNTAINRKAGLVLSDAQESRYRDQQRDARTINEYMHQRIRHTGCRNLLRTVRLKALYPHIDNQTFEY